LDLLGLVNRSRAGDGAAGRLRSTEGFTARREPSARTRGRDLPCVRC